MEMKPLSKEQKHKYYKEALRLIKSKSHLDEDKNAYSFGCDVLQHVSWDLLKEFSYWRVTQLIKDFFPEFYLFEPDKHGLGWWPYNDPAREIAFEFCIEMTKP